MCLKTVYVKLMFSKKATKIDEIFTNDLTLCSKCQIDCEDFAKFCDLLKGQINSNDIFHDITSLIKVPVF